MLIESPLVSQHSQARQEMEDAILQVAPMGRTTVQRLKVNPDVNQGIAVGTRMQSAAPTSEQSDAVYLVIRIAASLKATGIVVDAFGVVLSAPGGIFDEAYTVVAINGKRFATGMERS
eukprot:4346709-Prymnesium_polylepis.1